MRRQVTYWKEIFIRQISDQRLVSRIDKPILQVNHNNTGNLMIKEQNIRIDIPPHTHMPQYVNV
jgi:hypothetical protein